MLEGKDLISLEQHVIQGLRDQLTMQQNSILHIVRPGELCVSTLMNMEKDYVDGLVHNLTEKIDNILLTEAITE